MFSYNIPEGHHKEQVVKEEGVFSFILTSLSMEPITLFFIKVRLRQ
jgi:hypothetical protein